MPCVSGRAEMSSARDAVVVRAFRRECGILTLFNGSDGIHLAYAAYFGPFLSRSNLHCSILGRFRQHVQTVGFLYPGKLAIGAQFAGGWQITGVWIPLEGVGVRPVGFFGPETAYMGAAWQPRHGSRPQLRLPPRSGKCVACQQEYSCNDQLQSV